VNAFTNGRRSVRYGAGAVRLIAERWSGPLRNGPPQHAPASSPGRCHGAFTRYGSVTRLRGRSPFGEAEARW